MEDNFYRKILVSLIVVVLFFSQPIHARMVRDFSSLDIAGLVVENTSFLAGQSLFLAGVPEGISEAVAEAIRSKSLAFEYRYYRKDFLVMSFMDFVDMVKSLGGGWDWDKILEHPDLYYRMRGLEDKNMILYGYYSYSEEYGHTADDVLQAMRWLRTWNNAPSNENIQHIFLSAERIDFSIFTPNQLYNTPLINYVVYFHVEREQAGGIVLKKGR